MKCQVPVPFQIDNFECFSQLKEMHDTVLYIPGKSANDIMEKLNSDLSKLDKSPKMN